jgi:mRNA interferase MazF
MDIPFGKESIPIKIPRYLVQDIDTLEDWVRAEMMYKSMYQDSFDKWNDIKKIIHKKNNSFGFRERDILFLSVGKNVGFEVYGKDSEFLRPVLVLKKYGKYSFLGIPLSKQYKEGKFYYSFSYKKDILSTALLTQSRVFDIKRAKYRSGTIKKEDFKNLWKKYLQIITPSSEEEGSA